MTTPVGGQPLSTPPLSGEPPAVVHETEQFLIQHLPENIDREALSAALSLLSGELSSGNADLIQTALEGLVDRLPISDSLKTVIKALIPAYAAEVASTHAAGGPLDVTDTSESLAADLQIIETLFTAPPHLPELPPVDQTLIDSFRSSLEGLRGQTMTPEEFKTAIDGLLANFDTCKALIDDALQQLNSGAITPEQFQTLAHGILENLETRKTFQDAMEGLKNGTLDEAGFQAVMEGLTKEIEASLHAISGGGGSPPSGPEGKKALVNFWMFSCSVEFFKIASNISQLLTEMEREQGLLSIKMKECMVAMAKDAYTLAIAMTNARVQQLQTEAAMLTTEGICNIVQGAISLITGCMTLRISGSAEEVKLKTLQLESFSNVATQLTSAIQNFVKAGFTVNKAALEQVAGQSEATKEFINKIFQTMQDSLQKIQEGTSKIQEILKELWGMTQSIQRLSGEVRG